MIGQLSPQLRATQRNGDAFLKRNRGGGSQKEFEVCADRDSNSGPLLVKIGWEARILTTEPSALTACGRFTSKRVFTFGCTVGNTDGGSDRRFFSSIRLWTLTHRWEVGKSCCGNYSGTNSISFYLYIHHHRRARRRASSPPKRQKMVSRSAPSAVAKADVPICLCYLPG